MNIDLLIKMANQITDFWEGEAGHDVAVKEVATHLRRYWEPRMRKQMITYLDERQGSGLNDVAKAAVTLLAAQAAQAAQAKVAPAAPSGAAGVAVGAAVDKVAPANDFSRTPDRADKYGGDAG
jgi:formate dehydrogenase subunit delta